MSNVININLDARCVECRAKGATPSGLCLGCVAKAANPKARMHTAAGRTVQKRFAESIAARRKGA